MNEKLTRIAYILLSLLAVAFFFNLGAWGVLESSEARYADISRDMLVNGHWLTPQLLGIAHMDKPLLTYWLTALGQVIFGVNAFGSRFFLSVAYLTQIVLIYNIAKNLLKEKRTAIYTAAIYSTLPLVIISVRNLTTDAFLTTFELLSIFLVIRYYASQKLHWLYLTFVALGLTLFTKGPVGALIPALVMIPLSRNIRTKKHSYIHTAIGVVITLLIGALWYIALFIDNPEFLDIIWEQQFVQRITDADKLKRSEPFYYYIISLFGTMLPWSFLLFGKFKELKENKVMKGIALFWVGIPFLFFSSVSSKLILYVLPLVGGFALIFGWYFSQLETKKCRWIYNLFVVFYAILLSAGVITCLVLPSQFDSPFNWLSFFILLGGVAYLIWAKKHELKDRIILTSLALPLFLVPASGELIRDIEEEANGMTPVANFIESIDKNQDAKLIVFDKRLPSLTFATGRKIYNLVYKQHLILLQNVGFEPNLKWKEIFIDLQKKEELPYAKELVESKSILIFRKRIPEDFKWMTTNYDNREKIGKWIVFYNK